MPSIARVAHRPPNQEDSVPATDVPLPSGHQPIYFWLVARHGTRWPTHKRLEQYLTLVPLLREARNTEHNPWLADWESPFRDAAPKAGLLHPIGEREMQEQGARWQALLPGLFAGPYSPLETSFVSTQVHRTSASAIAFSQGLYPCAPASLAGAGCRPQPVALDMQPKSQDRLLRFFKMCPGYDAYRTELGPRLRDWERAALQVLAEPLEQRLGLPAGQVAPEHVGALWQLCQQEAALLGATDRVCGLFDEQEARLLEFVTDTVLFETKGHAACDSYASAAPLMADMLQRLSQAAGRNGSAGGERARIQVAHAETIAPLAALLRLFDSPGPCLADRSQEACSQAWAAGLPAPPQPRAWWGSTVMPFGGNVALLLHAAPGQDPLVRLLVNERVVPQPACGGAWDCPLQDFLEAFNVDWEAIFDDSCHADRPPCSVPT